MWNKQNIQSFCQSSNWDIFLWSHVCKAQDLNTITEVKLTGRLVKALSFLLILHNIKCLSYYIFSYCAKSELGKLQHIWIELASCTVYSFCFLNIKVNKMTFLSPNNLTRDSVMQISISVMLKRDFGGNMSI